MLLQGVPTPPPAPPPPETIVIGGSGPGPGETIAIVAIALSLAWLTYTLIGPLVRAWASRIEGKGNAQLEGRVRELEQHLAENESATQRIAELEERLDFAERLLAQRDDPARLPNEGRR